MPAARIEAGARGSPGGGCALAVQTAPSKGLCSAAASLKVMAKTWVLDTETKGTGAHMVPLEKVLRGRDREPELNLVKLRGPARPKPAPEPDPPQPRIFKILDLMTRETLAEGVDLRATVELLGDVRSIVDVQIYVWHENRRRWRMLGLDERRALWNARLARRLEPQAT